MYQLIYMKQIQFVNLVSVAYSVVFCVVLCRLFVIFVWPIYYLYFSDKGNKKIIEYRVIFQRERQNS